MFPLLIAVGMAVLLCAVVFLTSESESPETLIAAIKTGSQTKRWQKAFELSNELNRDGRMLRDTGVMREIIHILNDSARYDAKTRGYMAAALTYFDTPESVAALRAALGDAEEEVRLYALWALGSLDARVAAPDVRAALKDPNDGLRKMAAYVLGATGDGAARAALLETLADPVADVRWNAALALARLGDGSGRGVLVEMLNRETLLKVYSLSPEAADGVMINAIKGIGLVLDAASRVRLAEISRGDRSLKVREAALETLRAAGSDRS